MLIKLVIHTQYYSILSRGVVSWWSTDLWLLDGCLEVIDTMATLRLTLRAYTLHNPKKSINESTNRALMQGKQSMYQHVGIQRDPMIRFFSIPSLCDGEAPSGLAALSNLLVSESLLMDGLKQLTVYAHSKACD